MWSAMNKINKKEKCKIFHYNFFPKNRKGISIVIGYILLIAISIVMSIVVYQWLVTYVPTESIECDDGSSLFISSISYDCLTYTLDITVKNNGRFSLQGYFIHASNKTEGEIATIDLSHDVTNETGQIDTSKIYGNSIIFNELVENALNPGSPALSTFNVTKYGSSLKKIEIIPTRIQEIKGVKRLVTCGDAKIEEVLTCS